MPDNLALVRELSHVRTDREYIRRCKSGNTEDFVAASRILQSRKVIVPKLLVLETKAFSWDVEKLRINWQTMKEIFLEAAR